MNDCNLLDFCIPSLNKICIISKPLTPVEPKQQSRSCKGKPTNTVYIFETDDKKYPPCRKPLTFSQASSSTNVSYSTNVTSQLEHTLVLLELTNPCITKATVLSFLLHTIPPLTQKPVSYMLNLGHEMLSVWHFTAVR